MQSNSLPEYVRRRTDHAFVERVTQASRLSNSVARWSWPVGVVALGVAVWQCLATAETLKNLLVVVKSPKQLQARGEFRVAMIVMANITLFEPGPKDAPALVFVLPNEECDPLKLAETINRYKHVETAYADPGLEEARQFLIQEVRPLNARFLLPREWTDGLEIYLARLAIERKHLRQGYIVGMDVPVLFEPGETGAIATIPFGVIDSNM